MKNTDRTKRRFNDKCKSIINTWFQIKPGDTVTIGLVRDWEEMQVQAVPGETQPALIL